MAFFIRIIVAVVLWWLAMELIPAVADMLSINLSASALKVIKLCGAAIAFLYIVGGSTPSWQFWRRDPPK